MVAVYAWVCSTVLSCTVVVISLYIWGSDLRGREFQSKTLCIALHLLVCGHGGSAIFLRTQKTALETKVSEQRSGVNLKIRFVIAPDTVARCDLLTAYMKETDVMIHSTTSEYALKQCSRAFMDIGLYSKQVLTFFLKAVMM